MAGDSSGTLANGVEWYAEPAIGFIGCGVTQSWGFDRDVDVRFGISNLNGTGEAMVLPEGTELELLNELHTWDPETRTVSQAPGAEREQESIFTLSGVSEFDLVAEGACGFGRGTSFVEVTANVPNEPPAIDITGPTEDAEYYVGQDVEAAYECEAVAADQTIESCDGTLAVGELIDTSDVGTKSFTVKAVDSAGNEADRTVSYTVRKSKTGLRAEPLAVQLIGATSRRGLLNLSPVLRLSLTYEARVTDEGGKPVEGALVEFPRCDATTDAEGVATCGDTGDAVQSILDLGYAANFRGTDTHEGSGNLGHALEVLGIGLL